MRVSPARPAIPNVPASPPLRRSTTAAAPPQATADPTNGNTPPRPITYKANTPSTPNIGPRNLKTAPEYQKPLQSTEIA